MQYFIMKFGAMRLLLTGGCWNLIHMVVVLENQQMISDRWKVIKWGELIVKYHAIAMGWWALFNGSKDV